MTRIGVMAARLLSLAMAVASVAADTPATVTAAPDATDVAAALSTLLPTAAPTTTEDTISDVGLSIACQSDLLAAFFLHAAPSDDLASALTSYGSVLTSQACSGSGGGSGGGSGAATPPATAAADCSPAPSLWCDFSKVAPSSVLSKYTSYGRAAASFLPSGIAPLLTLASECPQAWYAAATMFPQGPGDLHDLVVLGECFATARAEAIPSTATGSGATETASGTGTDKKTSATASGTASGSPKPSSGAGALTAATMALPVVVVAYVTLAMML
ncbi:hypothetical protein SPBR_03158 [Sporothrix brasiliensis 5110]|uniref:DUF7735 domain-containing protein n=1 Tax=Sporothrix brasiliensis 5110 TaxID=1398154 RepID=A0A0C2IVF7_9PEZI|nr:uncharacterized protein SPBR_03158 [Sporothrix brasiliensis 5110]KIH93116.1 hypothetical protein SPBR_03158 [Sporothrix brasiliensis 5110]